MPTLDARLTTMEAALLTARGYGQPTIEQRGRDFVATANKNRHIAAALGRDPAGATRALVAVITRR